MHDFRSLAVHDDGSQRDFRPGVQAEYLMPEADAEHGNAGAELTEKFQTVPGTGRMPGTGRNADHAQRGVVGHGHEAGVVVLHHAGAVTEAAERLCQIVGKGIVIIYKQEHGFLPG